MEHKILNATHGSNKTPLILGNIEIPCYVLEDGTAVLSGRGMQNALGFPKNASGQELTKLTKNKRLEPFISNELAQALETPLEFKRIGSGGSQPVTYGQEATVLIDLCYVLIDAKNAGVKLTKNQLKFERQAEIIVRAFSKTGIITAVYNITGYQDKLVQGAINDWEWKLESKQKRPGVIGTWTKDLVYGRMAPGLLQELERKNPKNKKAFSSLFIQHFYFLYPCP